MNQPWYPATWTVAAAGRQLDPHLLGDEDLVVHRLDGMNLVRQHLERPYLGLRRLDQRGLRRPHLVGPHVVGTDLQRQLLGLEDLTVTATPGTARIMDHRTVRRASPAGRCTADGLGSCPAVLRDRGASHRHPGSRAAARTTAERSLLFRMGIPADHRLAWVAAG